MKKALTLCVFISTISTFLVAQTSNSLSLTPMTQTRTASKDSFEVVLKSMLKNNTSRSKTIVWTRIYQTITATWTAAICDKNACWATRVSTESFTLAAGESSNVDVHVYPNNTVGSAIVNVVLTDQDSATVSVVGRYGFNLPVAVSDLKNAYPDIQIFPNPTPQYFSIKDDQNHVFEAAVFDETGKQVAVFKNPNHQQLSIEGLAAGSYFVSLFNQKNEVLKVVPLVKF
jgi:predicted transcriptional regulator